MIEDLRSDVAPHKDCEVLTRLELYDCEPDAFWFRARIFVRSRPENSSSDAADCDAEQTAFNRIPRSIGLRSAAIDELRYDHATDQPGQCAACHPVQPRLICV